MSLKCRKCKAPITRHAKTGLCVKCGNEAKRIHPITVPPKEGVAADRARAQKQAEDQAFKLRYKESLKEIDRLQKALEASTSLAEPVDTIDIKPKVSSKTSEATVVWVASDWHVEETVGAEVGDLNRYNVQIAEARVASFFRSGLRLTNLLAQDVKISTILLALLGDFITNDIHDAESAEKNELQPVFALAKAQGLIISGIEFILKHSAYDIRVPCHSGNHARTTHKTRFSSEHGHSLEHLMYLHLAAYFRHEPRVKFLIPESYHSYVTVYDQVIRFHHGHAVKYGGGVGGLYIPVAKAIAQWQKGRRADLDVFGHFHQLRDGGNFICNGSIIGYNAFALAIRADFEKPKQALLLIDRDRGRTATWPILPVDKRPVA